MAFGQGAVVAGERSVVEVGNDQYVESLGDMLWLCQAAHLRDNQLCIRRSERALADDVVRLISSSAFSRSAPVWEW